MTLLPMGKGDSVVIIVVCRSCGLWPLVDSLGASNTTLVLIIVVCVVGVVLL